MNRKKKETGYNEMSRDEEREAQAREWIEGLFPRRGWDTAFQVMAERGDDRLLDGDTGSTSCWDKDTWEW